MSMPADAETFVMLYAHLSLIQGCADMAADGAAVAGGTGTLATLTGWLDVAVSALMQVLSWPDGPFNFHWDWDSLTMAQRLTRGAWIAAWFPILVNLALLVLPTPVQGKIAEDIDPMGKAWLTMAGAGMLGAGLAGAIKGLKDNPPTANGYTVAAAVLGPLPLLTTFPLLLNENVADSEGITAAIKILIDDLCDVAAGLLAPLA